MIIITQIIISAAVAITTLSYYEMWILNKMEAHTRYRVQITTRIVKISIIIIIICWMLQTYHKTHKMWGQTNITGTPIHYVMANKDKNVSKIN